MSDKYAALKQAKPYELRFSRLWERYDEACHGNAEHMRDILELTLDALETAERRIVNSDRDVLTLLAERDADKARIAELESRKVKLDRPKIGKLHGALIHVWSAYDVQTAIDSAGISLKIEGE